MATRLAIGQGQAGRGTRIASRISTGRTAHHDEGRGMLGMNCVMCEEPERGVRITRDIPCVWPRQPAATSYLTVAPAKAAGRQQRKNMPE